MGWESFDGDVLDLTLGPSFKVKRWFTGFGEVSFRWIEICIGSPMHRSSLFMFAGFTLFVLSSPYRCRAWKD